MVADRHAGRNERASERIGREQEQGQEEEAEAEAEDREIIGRTFVGRKKVSSDSG